MTDMELKAYIAPTPDGTGLADYYLKDEADKVIAHSNRKRCLSMAQWCMDAECKTEKEADFLVRWEYRWLALAEEPTWAKFLQLIRKEAK